MKIFLCALETELRNAWEQYCGDLDCVSIHRGSILDQGVNAFLAFRAVLLLIQHHLFPSGILCGEKISEAVHSIAVPGLGLR